MQANEARCENCLKQFESQLLTVLNQIAEQIADLQRDIRALRDKPTK